MFGAAFPLSPSQSFKMLAIGIILWFFGALLLAYLGPLGAYQGSGRILTYLLLIPGTVPFVWLAMKIAQLEGAQVGLGIALATGTATLCDGIALAWFPSLYGETIDLHAGAGSTILWGAGVAIFIGMLFSRPRTN